MTFLLVARRDLSSYLSGWYGPIIVALVVFIWGLLYNFVALGSGPRYSADVLETFFMFGGYATGTTAWLMSMRTIAEEKQTIVQLVAAGLGLAIVPRWASRLGMAGVRFVPLASREAATLDLLPMAAAWLRDARDPLREEMLDMLRLRLPRYGAGA